jgi:ABC-2 type transport system ATP-binding protein
MTAQTSHAIEAQGLVKTFGDVRAVDGVDLSVAGGSVYGVLGPNGAGKTTTIRMLATLLRPDGGSARVLGHDIVAEADAVRRAVSLTGQLASVDEDLTGRENLILLGLLLGLRRSAAKARARELLDAFGLQEAAGRLVKHYSGGMRRRLDIAASIVVTPQLMFLDEPTTGLDPRSRLGMWGVIEDLVRDGTTMLLTTQYLEEADKLASSIAVIDHGKVIASGTSDELKAHVGGSRLELVVESAASVPAAAEIMRKVGDGTDPAVDADRRAIAVPVAEGAGVLADVVRQLDAAGIVIGDLALRRPTLDDVFMRLTGHVAEDHDEAEPEQPAHEKGTRR